MWPFHENVAMISLKRNAAQLSRSLKYRAIWVRLRGNCPVLTQYTMTVTVHYSVRSVPLRNVQNDVRVVIYTLYRHLLACEKNLALSMGDFLQLPVVTTSLCASLLFCHVWLLLRLQIRFAGAGEHPRLKSLLPLSVVMRLE